MTRPLSTVEIHRDITRYITENEGNVRRLIGNDHNLSSGKYKEYLIRNMLKQHISNGFDVAEGIVTYNYPQRAGFANEINNIEGTKILYPEAFSKKKDVALSQQDGYHRPELNATSGDIDIMIIDNETQPLLQAGNFRIVTPDSVYAIAESKTLYGFFKFGQVVDDFANRIQGIRFHARLLGRGYCWAGLFIHNRLTKQHYYNHTAILSTLQRITQNNPLRVIDCISWGEDIFIHYWNNGMRDVRGEIDGPVWHSYQLKGLAPSYFVSNMVFHTRPEVDDLQFFPLPEGKETHRKFFVPLQGDIVRRFPEISV